MATFEEWLQYASSEELREAIRQIHQALWPDGAASEWDAETIEEVARIMCENGFGPDESGV